MDRKGGKGDQRHQRVMHSGVTRDITGSNTRDQEGVVPIGYVSGATPTYNQQPTPASVPDHKTAHEVLRDRGRQGIKNAEIEPGFEDL
jgi:hypothetical protein